MTPEANLRLRVRAIHREALTVARRAVATGERLRGIRAQMDGSKLAAQPITARAALARRGLAEVEMVEKFLLPEMKRIIAEVEGFCAETKTPPIGRPLSDLLGDLESSSQSVKTLLMDWLKSYPPEQTR